MCNFHAIQPIHDNLPEYSESFPCGSTATAAIIIKSSSSNLIHAYETPATFAEARA